MIAKKHRKTKLIEVNRLVIYSAVVLLLVTTFGSGYTFGLKNSNSSFQSKTITPTPQPQTVNQTKRNLDAVPPVNETDHILGDKNAPIVIIEYSDFQCPYCQRFHTAMLQTFKDYKGKVTWVMRNFPLTIHDKAEKLAEAGQCVANIGGNDAYWKMADSIFSGMPNVQLSDLGNLAEKSGVDKKIFQECLDSGKYAQQIKNEAANGSKAGVQGTPGSIIINKAGQKDFINGALPVDQIKAYVDKMLQQN